MKPLVKSHYVKSKAEVNFSRAGASQQALDEETRNTTYWINDLYLVARRILPGSPLIQLNIRRRDGRAILRDWRHFQEIKNQLVGEECEGVELYPAESRLVDISNKCHIWCHTDPKFRFPFGFDYRQSRTQTPSATRCLGYGSADSDPCALFITCNFCRFRDCLSFLTRLPRSSGLALIQANIRKSKLPKKLCTQGKNNDAESPDNNLPRRPFKFHAEALKLYRTFRLTEKNDNCEGYDRSSGESARADEVIE